MTVLLGLAIEFALVALALILLNTAPIGRDLSGRRVLAIALLTIGAFIVAVHTAGAPS
jgi:hypothetical protein